MCLFVFSAFFKIVEGYSLVSLCKNTNKQTFYTMADTSGTLLKHLILV